MTGGGYTKVGAATVINHLVASIKTDGWKYGVDGSESGVTVFSAYKDQHCQRALVGFHGVTDEALIFAWMELLPAENSDENTKEPQQLNDELAAVSVMSTRPTAPKGIVGT